MFVVIYITLECLLKNSNLITGKNLTYEAQRTTALSYLKGFQKKKKKESFYFHKLTHITVGFLVTNYRTEKEVQGHCVCQCYQKCTNFTELLTMISI